MDVISPLQTRTRLISNNSTVLESCLFGEVNLSSLQDVAALVKSFFIYGAYFSVLNRLSRSWSRTAGAVLVTQVLSSMLPWSKSPRSGTECHPRDCQQHVRFHPRSSACSSQNFARPLQLTAEAYLPSVDPAPPSSPYGQILLMWPKLGCPSAGCSQSFTRFRLAKQSAALSDGVLKESLRGSFSLQSCSPEPPPDPETAVCWHLGQICQFPRDFPPLDSGQLAAATLRITHARKETAVKHLSGLCLWRWALKSTHTRFYMAHAFQALR